MLVVRLNSKPHTHYTTLEHIQNSFDPNLEHNLCDPLNPNQTLIMRIH